VCDAAAARVTELVAGVPPYHPLHRDADKSLGALKGFLDRCAYRLRRFTGAEAGRLGFRAGDPAYVPAARPLGRAATAADVAAGRAVFHFNGKGKPVADAPAWVTRVTAPRWEWLRTDPIWLGLTLWQAVSGPPEDGLVVQAEAGPDGELVYGVIFRRAIRAVRVDEVVPVPDPKR
jgi:hypothetical protein